MAASVCPPCQDSPLSITGNVVGVLTFVYVLVIGAFLRLSAIKNAARELDILELEGEFLVRDFERIESKYKSREVSSVERYSQIEVVQQSYRTEIESLNKIQEKLKSRSSGVYHGWKRLVFGFRYLILRDQMKEGIQRTKVWVERVKSLRQEESYAGDVTHICRDSEVFERLRDLPEHGEIWPKSKYAIPSLTFTRPTIIRNDI